jgi:hypothetical protein
MKKATIAAFLAALAPAAPAGARASGCVVHGHRLYGRVQLVTAHADLRVKVVGSSPELRVQDVDAFANACGKWQLVDAFPDLLVQLVDAFPDVTIQWVDAFPGIGGGR